MLVTQTAFARLVGVSVAAVHKAIGEGRLHAEAGKLDPAHRVNHAFAVLHLAGADVSNGAVGPMVQVDALVTKAQWADERLTRLTQAHIERAIVASNVHDTLLKLRAAAPTLPQRYAKAFAGELEITEDEARAVLQDFANILLEETEGLAEQGRDAVMRSTR